MASEIIITKHQIPVIQYLAADGTSNLQESPLDVQLTMADLIRLAGDDAEIIGVLEPTSLQDPYREITEEVARAYLDEVRGSGMLLNQMPLYVQRSKAGASYLDEVSTRRPRNNGTYAVKLGRVA